MVMKASIFEKYINAILEADLPQIKTIRIGTKSLSFWPYRFITDPDAQDMLDLFQKVTDKGIHLAFMSHFNHPAELKTDALKEAVARIRKTGAQIRTQSPLLRNVNDDPNIWASMCHGPQHNEGPANLTAQSIKLPRSWCPCGSCPGPGWHQYCHSSMHSRRGTTSQG